MVHKTTLSSKLTSFVSKSKIIKAEITPSILKVSFICNLPSISRRRIRTVPVSILDDSSSRYKFRLAGLNKRARAWELGKAVSFNYAGKYWFYAFGLTKPNNNIECNE